MQGYLVKLLYVSLFSFSSLFMVSPLRQLPVKINRIIDGDTVVVGKTSIRLAYIDAPELKQLSIDNVEIGKQSRLALIKFLKNQKEVSVKLIGKDYFGRYLGELFVNDISVNKKLVADGFAVSYRDKFLYLEYIARKKKLGIWATKGFYYPKVHRKYKRKYRFKSTTKRYLGQN